MAGPTRPAKEKRSARRKHSFGGCRTCRRRHVKCDQVRPSCLACRAVNAVCEGYTSDVKWMTPSTLSSAISGQFDNGGDTSHNSTRHHLYSEVSRASMSTTLKQCFASTSVDSSLVELEVRTKELETSNAGHVTIGPFGVINVRAETHAPDLDYVSSPNIPATSDTAPISEQGLPNVEMLTQSVSIPNDMQPVPSVIDWFDPILGFDNTLHWADLFGLDFDAENSLLMPQQPSGQLGFSFENLSQDTTIQPQDNNIRPQDQTLLDDCPPPYSQVSNNIQPSNGPADRGNHSIILAEIKSVSEAQFLLKHFHDFVIPQMSFMPSDTKSPWTILQLPEAMRSLSELTYLHSGTLKHANAANLFGLLACAAYHLAANPAICSTEPQAYWKNLSTRLKGKAKSHMQISLREELRGPAKAKYKDQLMAILSMLAFTSISGQPHDARYYMIDAERLLRVKGLAKRDVSRKSRVLHHVYSWIRIVGESTYVIHDYSSYGPVVDKMSAAHRAGRLHGGHQQGAEDILSRTGHNARLDDFLRLEPHSSDSDLDIDDVKEHEVSLRDIHLEDSRQYKGTLYNIYGISETWLSLVSQTTRLANILDAAQYGKDTDVRFLEFLQRRAGRLENIICSFSLKDPSCDDEEASQDSAIRHPLNFHMLRAMNSALVILFYRRIRNVNPLILQGHVDSVVQSLREFDAALLSKGVQGPGSPWPAFIAGCEALSRQNKRFLLAWIDKGFEICGLDYFSASSRLMKEVWERQDDPTVLLDPGSGGSGHSRHQKSASYQPSWVHVSREKKFWVMLF